jgi:hypothetical protein
VTEFSQPQPAQVVQPQPAPETWQCDVTSNQLVLIVISSVSGQHVSFMPPDVALSVAENIVNTARRAKSGIIIVQNLQQPSSNGGSPTALEQH